MQSRSRTARLAGFLYLMMGFSGPFSLIYVPRKLIVRGDAAATASNILSSEMLFRAGMVAELFGTVMFILTAVTLYELLNEVNRKQAALMVTFVAISIPISFISVVNELAALTLIRGAYLSAFTKPQLDAMALFFLGLRTKTILVNQIFWGLWLIPFGWLVFRSGFLPKILGALLVLNGLVYPFVSVMALLSPDSSASALHPLAIALETGELWIMLWLLIMGAKERALE